MITISVWLLMMVGPVNSGALGAVQPQLFPTYEACKKVIDGAPIGRYSNPGWVCIQTTVLVPK